MMESIYREMNQDEVAIFLRLKLATDSSIDDLYKEVKKASWQIEAITKYATAFNLDIDKRVQIMIIAICDGAIGKVVNCIAKIHAWADKHQQRDIDFDTFSMRIFPWGFPDFSNHFEN